MLLARTYILAMVAVTGSLTSATAVANRDVLAGERRLDALVTVHEPMTTLGDAAEQVGKQCGVPLSVDQGIREGTIILLVQRRTGREVLEQLAASLGYTWTPWRPDGYRLVEGQEALRRADLLRRRHRREAAADAERQLGLIQRYLAEHERLTAQEASDSVERLRVRADNLPVSPDRLAAEEEYRCAYASLQPATKVLLRAYLSLPPELQNRVLLGERVVMASQWPNAVQMPGPILAALRDLREAQARRSLRPMPGRQSEGEVVAFSAAMHRAGLVLKIHTRQSHDRPGMPGVTLPVRQRTASFELFGPPLTEHRPGKLTAERSEMLRQKLKYGTPSRSLDAADPLTYCRGLLLPEVFDVLVRGNPGFAVVGDAYFKGMHPTTSGAPAADGDFPRARPPAREEFARLVTASGPAGCPMGELLRRLAELGGTDVHVTGDAWIRVRSTTYFNDRAGEIDPRLIRELFGAVAEGAAYTPDIAIHAAKRLTYGQATALSAPYLEFLTGRIDHDLAESYDAWNLVGRLQERHRSELLAGRVVPYSRFSAQETEAFRTFVQNASSRPEGDPIDLQITPGEIASWSLQLAPVSAGQTRSLVLRREGYRFPLWTARLKAQEPNPARRGADE